MEKTTRVLILSQTNIPEKLIDKVKGVSPHLEIRHHRADSIEEAGEVWSGVEVLYTSGMLPAPDQAPHLRWVQGEFAGVDKLRDHPLFKRVTLTNASGIHAPVIGEYVLMMMLAFSHKLPLMMEHQRRAEWTHNQWYGFNAQELRGATVGILGYGSIGREVGRLARAFGMRVLALKRNADNHADAGYRLPGLGDAGLECVDRLYGRNSLNEMLPECDHLVVTVPLTLESRGMIGAAQLALLKPGALLVNVARGAVVDEAAMIDALQSGRLGGAALDVFTEEPLPEASPLWRLPNVLLSPHISDANEHYLVRVMDLFAENLGRYLAGRPLLNVVDVQAGY